MQIKNRKKIFIFCFLSLFFLNLNVYADEFNITAVEISVDAENDIIIGKGSVEATDKEGNIIKADKIKYTKKIEFLEAEGSVEIFDVDGNILKSNKATYDKLDEIITSLENSELEIEISEKFVLSFGKRRFIKVKFI